MPKYKSAETGRFVSEGFAKANPGTTFKKKTKKKTHKSDCAIYNAPAKKPGKCDCGVG
jgi:hypothetical protein